MKNTFFRFLLVGGLNAAFGYSVFALLLYFGLHYSVATLISTCLGVLFNFKTIGNLVFKNGTYSLFFKFVGVYVVVYFANIGCLKLFALYKFDLYLGAAILIVPMALLSYLLNRFFVYKEKKIITGG